MAKRLLYCKLQLKVNVFHVLNVYVCTVYQRLRSICGIEKD